MILMSENASGGPEESKNLVLFLPRPRLTIRMALVLVFNLQHCLCMMVTTNRSTVLFICILLCAVVGK